MDINYYSLGKLDKIKGRKLDGIFCKSLRLGCIIRVKKKSKLLISRLEGFQGIIHVLSDLEIEKLDGSYVKILWTNMNFKLLY